MKFYEIKMVRIKAVFIFSFLIIVISCIAFFFITSSLVIFSFSGETFFKGQVWRLITYPFAHVNLMHLIENIIALSITALLAYELELKGKQFIIVFSLSGIIIALAEAFLFPTLLIAGLSVGIYALLGSLSIKRSNFISRSVLMPLVGLSVFLKYLFSMFDKELLSSSLFHFSGFITGMGIFYLLIKLKKKKRILQEM